MKRNHILLFNECDAAIDYVARKAVPGPEKKLVEYFLANGISGKDYSFRSQNMAVFVEPRVDSGFPDVVIAEYKPDFFSRWSAARSELGGSELKLLSFLYSVRGADSACIQEKMNLKPVEILRSTERLQDADLIFRDKAQRMWRPRPLEESFGLERLIAIEAKISNSQRVLNQATLNSWFASESYALTPVEPNVAFARLARHAGIGVVTGDQRRAFRRVIRPRMQPLPLGYVSWQFNEWIGKRLVQEGAK